MSALPLSEAAWRGTIVIAEDDVATRMLLCRVLTRERFRVIAVGDGKLACEAVRREHPDVVLLDWRMPVMDGRAALEELKAHKETRGIPIVMLTSRSQVDERIIALEAGVQDFLSKPFDPRELVACIEQQLRWQQGLAGDADAAFIEERNALVAASERRYRLLAEAMPHMVWMADPSGRITYVNRAWYDYTGIPFERISRDGWGTAVHPDDVVASTRAWSRSIETGEPYELQYRFRRGSDGMYRWHLGRATPTSDTDGNIIEWVGSCADIHDYKIATETRTILDTIGSIVSIRTAGGFIDYTSPYWSQYTGSHPDSGLGFGWRAFIHPDDIAIGDTSRALTGAPDGASRKYELRIRGHDGHYRWFLSHSTMLPNTTGDACRWLETATDVDDLKRTQSALENSESRYRALTDSMPQMVWVIDAKGHFEYVNHRWTEYTGFTLGQMSTYGQAVVIATDDLPSIAALHGAATPAEYVCEARFRRHDGSYRWHVIRAVPFEDLTSLSHKWIATATDIHESKLAAAKLATTAAELEHLAHYDPLTSLPNRLLLLDRLAQAITLAQRGRSGVIVLFLDLDRFKIINDTLGHAAGDRVLRVTAKRIADALRTGDTASRVGGDEFVLVCATSEGAEDAAGVAGRLLTAIGQPIDLDGESVTVGASIGISLFPTDGADVEDLIKKADGAMYAAKQSGRNVFRLYSAQTHHSVIAALDLESELREALATQQIVVHYQPIMSMHGRPIAAEALVRWQHPQRGLLLPINFLSFAEDHRLIVPIGNAVLEAVCAQIAALERNPVTDTHFTIAMNVSARQFSDTGFFTGIANALARHDAQPRRLCIEISEHVLCGDPAAAKTILDNLRSLGVQLAIDNFGNGYSSLASIRTFPLHALKIDRSFVQNLDTDESHQAVAKTIVTLAHSLNLQVVAEGVETTAQRDAVRALGADAFQGHLISPAIPASDLTTFLTTPHNAVPN